MMSGFEITIIPEYFGIAGFILWAAIERWFYMSGHQQVGEWRKDYGTYWLISIFWYTAILVSILDTIYFSWTPPGFASRELRWLGIPLIIIGLIARIMTRQALGKQYSVLVETSESHQLVTDGVYSKLRHPAYFGLLNVFIGIPLSL
jgi:protein-S-isoprenylcysteine O-methyltransferase Ste14